MVPDMQSKTQHGGRTQRVLSLPMLTAPQDGSSTDSTCDSWPTGSSENNTSESSEFSRQSTPLPPDGATRSEHGFRRHRYPGLQQRSTSAMNRASVQDVYESIMREAPDAKVSHIFHTEEVAAPGLIPIAGPQDFHKGLADVDVSFILVDGDDACSHLATHMLRSRAGRFAGVVIVVILEQPGTANSTSITEHVSTLVAVGADDVIVVPMGAGKMGLTISVTLAKVKEQRVHKRNLKRLVKSSQAQCHGLFWEVAHELIDGFPQVRPDVCESRDKCVGQMSFVRKLGAGNYGSVFACKENGKEGEGAVKVLSKSKIDSIQSIMQVCTEFTLLQKLSHPNVVKLHSVIHGMQNLYIFMEMAGPHNLVKMIATEEASEGTGAKGLTWRKGQDILQQITDGVAHCHDMGVAHCDLKPENIVISPEGCVKLVDFGQAVDTAIEVPLLHAPRGTMPFVPPEVMCLSRSWDPRAADVWAVGVIIVEVLCGYNAFVHLMNWQGINLMRIQSLKNRANDLKTFFRDEAAALEKVSGCCRNMPPASVIEMLGGILKFLPEERLAAKRVFDIISDNRML